MSEENIAQNDIKVKISEEENNPPPPGIQNKLDETTKTEETIIQNEGAEDDYIISDSENIKLNENKVKELVNSNPEEEENITPEKDQEQKNDLDDINLNANIESNNININYKNKNDININKERNKIVKKKSKIIKKITLEEKDEKNKNDENTDELFKKAIENSVEKYPPIEHDNNISGKVTEVLYDKYVGRNIQKSKHLDIYSKFKDESIRQEREFNRTKDDAKRISNMIERQEKYEEIKHDKKIGIQK